jgi:hypothetical protein
VPIPIQAHFEGVVFSVIAPTDQMAQGINSAGVRSYAVNPVHANDLWRKSEEMVGERFSF